MGRGLLVGVVELWMWAVWRAYGGVVAAMCAVGGGPSSGCVELEFWLWGHT